MRKQKAYYIDPELQKFVKEEAKRRRMTQSALIEHIIELLKKEVEKEQS